MNILIFIIITYSIVLKLIMGNLLLSHSNTTFSTAPKMLVKHVNDVI